MGFTDILGAVIHLYELVYVKKQDWVLKNNFIMQKVAKLLGTTDSWFFTYFG